MMRLKKSNISQMDFAAGSEGRGQESLPTVLKECRGIVLRKETVDFMNELGEAFESWTYWAKTEREAKRLRAVGFVVQRMVFDEFYSDDAEMEYRMFGVGGVKMLEGLRK